MLLGFFDRNGDGLAVELSPEMASDIACLVGDILNTIEGDTGFAEVSEIRIARYAFENVYRFNRYTNNRPPDNEYIVLPEDELLFVSKAEQSTGVILDVEGDPAVFWEIYDAHRRFTTPYLSLSDLDAIANNRPLPTATEE